MIQKKTTQIQRLKKQAAATKCRWIFMSRCAEHNVLPRSFRTRPVLRTRKGYVLTKEYNQRMLKATRDEAKKQYHQRLRRIDEIENELIPTVSTEDLTTIWRVTEKSRENKFQKEKKRLKEKYEKLTANTTQEGNPARQLKLQHEVHDLTKDGIDDDIKEYLKLGPDFCETPRRIPYEKVVIETERMCKVIEDEIETKPDEAEELQREAHRLREQVKKVLRKQREKKIKSNLTIQESRGKKKAYECEDKVFLPADKGKVMVAMDKTIEKGGEESYEHKMKKVLDDMKATPSIRANKDWDLTDKVSREGQEIIKGIVRNGEITQAYGKKLSPNDCRAPRVTGYPKVHKVDVPLRGVVSFIGSPYEKIANELVPILRSLQGRTKHYIKNSCQLKEELKNWTILRDEILVSYDVEKLYPSIPIPKALELIECLLKCKANLKEVTTLSVQSIMKLLKWIFALTYCEYGGKHYVLDCGPIGLSVTGEVAIIYMEDFQMHAKTEEHPELNNWPWYVDDSVLKCRRHKAQLILDHLNSIEPEHIRFTKEEEEDNKLAVLDLELNVNRKKKKIEFNVHYKKTNTNITIKKKSNHTDSTKRGIIKGYSDRAKKLCDPEYLNAELKNVKEVFQENGYSEEEIEAAMKGRVRATTENDTEQRTRGIVVIQNIPNITPQFNKIARQHGFKVANKSGTRVKDLTTKAKTPLGDKNSNVIYNIPCGCKKYSYTGETHRKWETRRKEHHDKVRLTKQDIESGNLESATTRMNTNDGGLAKHTSTCNEEIRWEHAKIVGREERWTQRKYLEGIESLREKNKGITPLNSYNQLEQWQSTLYPYFQKT